MSMKELMNEGKTTCGNPSRGHYVQGCRCYMCRVANADYARTRTTQGKGSAMVGKEATARARKKVRDWLEDGYPLREISRATGIERKVLKTLLTGEHPNAKRFANGKPRLSARMSRANYDRIMKLERPSAPLGGKIVDARSLNSAISWLYSHGVTPYQVAMESGIPLGTIYQLGTNDRCEYKTLARLAGAAEKLKRESLVGGDDRG